MSLTLLTAGLLGVSSCSKLKDELFKAFTTSGGQMDFTIPIIDKTGTSVEWGTMVSYINIDSVIKAETDNNFSLNDIKGIYIEEATIRINNPDAANNFANFVEGSIEFSTNTVPTPVFIASGPIADVFATEYSLPPIGGINLKNYLNGNILTYKVYGVNRRVTTKTLNCTLFAKFKIE